MNTTVRHLLADGIPDDGLIHAGKSRRAGDTTGRAENPNRVVTTHANRTNAGARICPNGVAQFTSRHGGRCVGVRNAVESTATQLLTGLTLAAGGKTQCTNCHRPIREGDAVGVYAIRPADAGAFDLPRVYCEDCRDESLPREDATAVQLLAFGRAGVTSDGPDREGRLTLHETELVANAPRE